MKEEEIDDLIKRVNGLKELDFNEFPIRVGSVYRYKNKIPRGCKGKKYRVDRFFLAVPVYQIQVLVEALEGKDVGLSVGCTPANFAIRYEPVPEEKK